MRAIRDEYPLVENGVRVGVSPHAPYSCGAAVFEAAADLGLPATTHLAETLAEVEVCQSGTGPLREMLEHDIGAWNASIEVPGVHPVDALLGPLGRGRFLCVHVNWIEPRHVQMLAASGVRVVYCPRASAAFGHAPPQLLEHPWRSLHEAGVNVCLGTDSLLCLDTPDRLSVLDDMRLLYRRDGVDARLLLAMATVHGAKALDLEPGLAMLGPDAAGVIACPAQGTTAEAMLADVLRRDEAPVWVERADT
jgi:cytosine/adenosine deaminase-related metal-dependent hydrolase